ncbi:MAG TPA: hypothetical protein VM554_13025 [Acidisarcina sp.]|nr:hypothetical protein [Acidisarcina sp.]
MIDNKKLEEYTRLSQTAISFLDRANIPLPRGLYAYFCAYVMEPPTGLSELHDIEEMARELLAARAANSSASAIGLIAAERRRQIEVEGFTSEHDDEEHWSPSLTNAAQAYAGIAVLQERYADVDLSCIPACWPWDAKWWKPSTDPVRNRVKAAALIAADIDRLQRAKAEARAKQRGTGGRSE